MTRAVEGAEDRTAQAAPSCASTTIAAADALIAVAASGTTPFTLACLREPRQRRRAHNRHRQQSRRAAAGRGGMPGLP